MAVLDYERSDIMTDTEINLEIATFCGWSCIKESIHGGLIGLPFKGASIHKSVPDFCNDLDAVHEAEKKLSRSEAIRYQDNLITITVTLNKLFPIEGMYSIDGYVIHATAAQRCEALLKTIGKWKS